MSRTPEASQGESHALLSQDGVRLEATHWPGPGRTASAGDDLVLVVAHGFGGSRHRDDNAAVLRSLRSLVPVVALDFRGHGGSAGHTTMGHREVLDLDAAVRWARTLQYRRVVTVGFSMGASIVVRHGALHGRVDTGPDPTTAREAVDAVVAVSGPAFWFYRGTAAMRTLHRLVETPVGRAILHRAGGPRVDVGGWDPHGPQPMSPEQSARLLAPVPLLVVHGDADTFFPVEHADALVAAYRAGAAERGATGARCDCWIEPGFGHAEAHIGPDLIDRVVRWTAAAVAVPVGGGAVVPGPRDETDPPPALVAP